MWKHCNTWCTFMMGGDDKTPREEDFENIDPNLINCNEVNEDLNSKCN